MNFGRGLVIALFVALAGCGGGGSSAQPAPLITAPPQPDGSFVANGTNTATLTLKFPVRSSTAGAKRAPAYVSPSSTQLLVTISTYNGSSTLPSFVPSTPTTIALTTTGGSPNCSVSASIETCTATVPAPPGSVGYTFTVEDGSGTALATLSTTLAIAQGQTNSALAISLQGIAATVALTPPSLTANSAIAAPGSAIALTAFDPDGNQITGSTAFNNPITLTDNDSSGATQLSVNSGTAASSVVVTKPTDVVTIQYSGLAIVPFTIGWTGSDIAASTATVPTSSQPIAFSGTTLDSVVGDVNYNKPTLYFYFPTVAPQALSISESGWSNAPYNRFFNYALDPTSCGSGGSAVATVSPASGSAVSYSVTPQNDGICKITVSDFTGGQTAVAWIAVDSTSFSVNSKGRVK
jgi:hypothetical protein